MNKGEEMLRYRAAADKQEGVCSSTAQQHSCVQSSDTTDVISFALIL